MARTTYYVVKAGNAWKVKVGDKEWPYSTQADAMAAARNAAKVVYDNGGLSQVLIQGRDGKWQTEWTYGDDPRRSPG